MKKFKPIDFKSLQKLEVEVTDNGVTVWITEKIKGKNLKHWLIDGSLAKHDGELKLSGFTFPYKYHAIYNEKTNAINFVSVKQTGNQ